MKPLIPLPSSSWTGQQWDCPQWGTGQRPAASLPSLLHMPSFGWPCAGMSIVKFPLHEQEILAAPLGQLSVCFAQPGPRLWSERSQCCGFPRGKSTLIFRFFFSFKFSGGFEFIRFPEVIGSHNIQHIRQCWWGWASHLRWAGMPVVPLLLLLAHWGCACCLAATGNTCLVQGKMFGSKHTVLQGTRNLPVP